MSIFAGVAGQFTAAQRVFISFAERGFREGLSGLDAYRVFNEASKGEYSMRRTTYMEVWRYVSEIAESGYHIQNVPKDKYPDVSRIPFAKTEIGFDYSYTVRVGWQHDAEGDFVLDDKGNRQGVFVQVVSDLPLTVAEIEEDALAAVEEGGDNYREEIEDVVVTGALRKGESTRFGR